MKENVTIPPNETITLSFDELAESSFLKASLMQKMDIY